MAQPVKHRPRTLRLPVRSWLHQGVRFGAEFSDRFAQPRNVRVAMVKGIGNSPLFGWLGPLVAVVRYDFPTGSRQFRNLGLFGFGIDASDRTRH